MTSLSAVRNSDAWVAPLETEQTGTRTLDEATLAILDEWVSEGEPKEKRAEAKIEFIQCFQRQSGSLHFLNLTGFSDTLSLTSLPDIFNQFPFLKDICLSHNNLNSLPNSLCQLPCLQSLNLSFNNIKILPKNFGDLTSLQSLKLSFNNLKTLPENFGDLTSLQTLDLGCNPIENLPESFGKLTSLKKLFLYDLHSKLNTLPKSFGKLTWLEELWLQKNSLESLPSSFTKLHTLQTIWGMDKATLKNLLMKAAEELPPHFLKKLMARKIGLDSLQDPTPHILGFLEQMQDVNCEFSSLIERKKNDSQEAPVPRADLL